jgi:hypothetical protein
MMSKFRGSIVVNYEIDVYQEVLDAVDDEWRSSFYKLETDKEIAAHIAYNEIMNGCKLSDLEGFANFPDEYAEISIASIIA